MATQIIVSVLPYFNDTSIATFFRLYGDQLFFVSTVMFTFVSLAASWFYYQNYQDEDDRPIDQIEDDQESVESFLCSESKQQISDIEQELDYQSDSSNHVISNVDIPEGQKDEQLQSYETWENPQNTKSLDQQESQISFCDFALDKIENLSTNVSQLTPAGEYEIGILESKQPQELDYLVPEFQFDGLLDCHEVSTCSAFIEKGTESFSECVSLPTLLYVAPPPYIKEILSLETTAEVDVSLCEYFVEITCICETLKFSQLNANTVCFISDQHETQKSPANLNCDLTDSSCVDLNNSVGLFKTVDQVVIATNKISHEEPNDLLKEYTTSVETSNNFYSYSVPSEKINYVATNDSSEQPGSLDQTSSTLLKANLDDNSECLPILEAEQENSWFNDLEIQQRRNVIRAESNVSLRICDNSKVKGRSENALCPDKNILKTTGERLNNFIKDTGQLDDDNEETLNHINQVELKGTLTNQVEQDKNLLNINPDLIDLCKTFPRNDLSQETSGSWFDKDIPAQTKSTEPLQECNADKLQKLPLPGVNLKLENLSQTGAVVQDQKHFSEARAENNISLSEPLIEAVELRDNSSENFTFPEAFFKYNVSSQQPTCEFEDQQLQEQLLDFIADDYKDVVDSGNVVPTSQDQKYCSSITRYRENSTILKHEPDYSQEVNSSFENTTEEQILSTVVDVSAEKNNNKSATKIIEVSDVKFVPPKTCLQIEEDVVIPSEFMDVSVEKMGQLVSQFFGFGSYERPAHFIPFENLDGISVINRGDYAIVDCHKNTSKLPSAPFISGISVETESFAEIVIEVEGQPISRPISKRSGKSRPKTNSSKANGTGKRAEEKVGDDVPVENGKTETIVDVRESKLSRVAPEHTNNIRPIECDTDKQEGKGAQKLIEPDTVVVGITSNFLRNDESYDIPRGKQLENEYITDQNDTEVQTGEEKNDINEDINLSESELSEHDISFKNMLNEEEFVKTADYVSEDDKEGSLDLYFDDNNAQTNISIVCSDFENSSEFEGDSSEKNLITISKPIENTTYLKPERKDNLKLDKEKGKYRSKSLSGLPSEKNAMENFLRQNSSHLDDTMGIEGNFPVIRKSQSAELPRRKPRIVISANYEKRTIKETNLDELMKSLESVNERVKEQEKVESFTVKGKQNESVVSISDVIPTMAECIPMTNEVEVIDLNSNNLDFGKEFTEIKVEKDDEIVSETLIDKNDRDLSEDESHILAEEILPPNIDVSDSDSELEENFPVSVVSSVNEHVKEQEKVESFMVKGKQSESVVTISDTIATMAECISMKNEVELIDLNLNNLDIGKEFKEIKVEQNDEVVSETLTDRDDKDLPADESYILAEKILPPSTDESDSEPEQNFPIEIETDYNFHFPGQVSEETFPVSVIINDSLEVDKQEQVEKQVTTKVTTVQNLKLRTEREECDNSAQEIPNRNLEELEIILEDVEKLSEKPDETNKPESVLPEKKIEDVIDSGNPSKKDERDDYIATSKKEPQNEGKIEIIPTDVGSKQDKVKDDINDAKVESWDVNGSLSESTPTLKEESLIVASKASFKLKKSEAEKKPTKRKVENGTSIDNSIVIEPIATSSPVGEKERDLSLKANKPEVEKKQTKVEVKNDTKSDSSKAKEPISKRSSTVKDDGLASSKTSLKSKNPDAENKQPKPIPSRDRKSESSKVRESISGLIKRFESPKDQANDDKKYKDRKEKSNNNIGNGSVLKEEAVGKSFSEKSSKTYALDKKENSAKVRQIDQRGLLPGGELKKATAKKPQDTDKFNKGGKRSEEKAGDFKSSKSNKTKVSGLDAKRTAPKEHKAKFDGGKTEKSKSKKSKGTNKFSMFGLFAKKRDDLSDSSSGDLSSQKDFDDLSIVSEGSEAMFYVTGRSIPSDTESEKGFQDFRRGKEVIARVPLYEDETEMLAESNKRSSHYGLTVAITSETFPGLTRSEHYSEREYRKYSRGQYASESEFEKWSVVDDMSLKSLNATPDVDRKAYCPFEQQSVESLDLSDSCSTVSLVEADGSRSGGSMSQNKMSVRNDESDKVNKISSGGSALPSVERVYKEGDVMSDFVTQLRSLIDLSKEKESEFETGEDQTDQVEHPEALLRDYEESRQLRKGRSPYVSGDEEHDSDSDALTDITEASFGGSRTPSMTSIPSRPNSMHGLPPIYSISTDGGQIWQADESMSEVMSQAANAVQRRRRSRKDRCSVETAGTSDVYIESIDTGVSAGYGQQPSEHSSNLSVPKDTVPSLTSSARKQKKRTKSEGHLSRFSGHIASVPNGANSNTTSSHESFPRFSKDTPSVVRDSFKRRHRTTSGSDINKDTKASHVQGNVSLNSNLSAKRRYENIQSMPDLSNKSHSPRATNLSDIETDDWVSDDTGLFSDATVFNPYFDDDNVLFNNSSFLRQRPLSRSSDIDEAFSVASDDSSGTSSDFFSPRSNMEQSHKIISCAYPPCGRRETVKEKRNTTFTSCVACFTYYCSKECRKSHWQDHKNMCYFGRVTFYTKSLIRRLETNLSIRYQLSKMAQDGFHRKGRGCVMINFTSPVTAKFFLVSGTDVFPSSPMYTSIQEVTKEGITTKHQVLLLQTLQDYNPGSEFVTNIGIAVGQQQETDPSVPPSRHNSNIVLRCAKLPLHPDHVDDDTPPNEESSYEIKVFYLPKSIQHDFVSDAEARRYYCQEISRGLRRYGIRLKIDYPETYEKLCLYVEHNIGFMPMTLYGQAEGKNFKCIIFPEGFRGTADRMELEGRGVMV